MDVCASAGTELVVQGDDLFIYTSCRSPFGSRKNLYKSFDGANSWISLDTIVASDSIVPKDFDGVEAVAVDPSNRNHIVVTSRYTDCYPFSCLYETNDGGAHWKKAPSPDGVSVKEVHFDPYMPRTLYLTSGLELVMRSTDGGNSWDTLDVGGQRIFLTGRPGTIYVSNLNPDQRFIGLFKSENSGDVWSDRVSLLEMAFVRQVESPEVAPDVLYARTTVAAENPKSGLWKSIDGAGTWNAVASGDNLDDLVVSPVDPDHLFVVVDQGQFTGDSIFESKDGGVSWGQVDTTIAGFPKGITNLLRRNNDLYVFSLSKLFVYEGAFSTKPSARASLENPSSSSFQSGIGLISGWACGASRVSYRVDNGDDKDAAYGTSRNDTVPICGGANNGFGALINWNLLGDGNHTIRAYADGVEFGSATFSVTTLGVAFLRGAGGQYLLSNFPFSGESVVLRWQEGSQNFVIADASFDNAAEAEPVGTQGAVAGSLENPSGASFQSGIGVISGWVCSAGEITLTIDGGAPFPAAYGTSRTDTVAICGDANNGFGRLINWNLLGSGTHTVRAFADGMQLGEATFTVTTLGFNFLTGASGQYLLPDFAGNDVTVRWQEGQQNFVIAGRE